MERQHPLPSMPFTVRMRLTVSIIYEYPKRYKAYTRCSVRSDRNMGLSPEKSFKVGDNVLLNSGMGRGKTYEKSRRQTFFAEESFSLIKASSYLHELSPFQQDLCGSDEIVHIS